MSHAKHSAGGHSPRNFSEHEDGIYHPIFGIDGSEPAAFTAPDEAELPNLYVGRDTIKRQAQSSAEMLYAVPDSSKDSDAVVSVAHLSELSSKEPLTKLGNKLGTQGASSVDVTGAMDFCAFLNGSYLRLKGVEFSKKPVFRTKTVASSDTPSFCNGNHLYLFYHERNSAWVIGMKVNTGSGACAYIVSNEASPEKVKLSETKWHVSMENGGFSICPTMKCTVGQDAEVDPPPDFVLPGNTNIPGRVEAEAMLRQYFSKLPASIGTFVLRESTSVPNAHVISMIVPEKEIEHLIVTKGPDGKLYLDPQYLENCDPNNPIAFSSLQHVQSYGTLTGFIIRHHKVTLKRCICGQEFLR